MNYKRRSRSLDKRRWAACGCCEIITPGKEPIEDGSCMGKASKKKPRPKKDKCPVNRVHEWYKEDVIETRRYIHPFYKHLKSYDLHYHQKTCIHCWKVVRKSIRQPYSWRRNKLVLPKRPVKEVL